MFKKSKTARTAALLVSLALMAVLLTSCFRQPINFRPDNGEQSPSTASSSTDSAQPTPSVSTDPKDRPSKEPVEQTPEERFAEVVRSILMTSTEKTDILSGVQIDAFINPGTGAASGNANYSNITARLTAESDGETTEAVIATEAINNAQTGEASSVTTIDSGSETAVSSGIYFTENTVLIQKANVEQPMIQHTLNPAVAESYAGLTAAERFNRVLSDANAPKLSPDDWSAAIDGLLAVVADNAQEADYTTSQMSGVYAGVELDCTVDELMLIGDRGVDIVRELLSLIAKDSSFCAFFNTIHEINEEEYGLTGINGMLRDIDAMNDETRDYATTTIKATSADSPLSLRIDLKSGDRVFSFVMTFYEDGNVHKNDLLFYGFDSSAVFFREANVSTGGDNYKATVSFEGFGPGHVLQESLTMTTDSTIQADAYDAKTSMTYTRASLDDMDAVTLSSDFMYAQTTSGGQTTGNSSGTLSFSLDGETTSIAMDVAVEKSDENKDVTPPAFLAGSGVSTADQSGLYAALGDFDGAGYTLAPLTLRLLAAQALMLN